MNGSKLLLQIAAKAVDVENHPFCTALKNAAACTEERSEGTDHNGIMEGTYMDTKSESLEVPSLAIPALIARSMTVRLWHGSRLL